MPIVDTILRGAVRSLQLSDTKLKHLKLSVFHFDAEIARTLQAMPSLEQLTVCYLHIAYVMELLDVLDWIKQTGGEIDNTGTAP